jgi:chemotaxis protein MotA
MFFIIGLVVVMGSVIGGYVAAGGHVAVLWQPFEFVIIFGAAIGAFVIGNPGKVLPVAIKAIGRVLKGPKQDKSAYLELLGAMYAIFKFAKTKGDLALESHLDRPHESSLFQKYPKFCANHHALEFMCDYLRLMTLGTTNAHEVEALMDKEMEVHHQESHAITAAWTTVADAMPALGIVAAVLGVIHTMGSITEPPEVLGHLIGGALVGTFSGVLVSYGIVAPIARSMEASFAAESHYIECLKAGLLAHMQGYAPQVSVEFARKALNSFVRPSFAELDEMLQNVTL